MIWGFVIMVLPAIAVLSGLIYIVIALFMRNKVGKKAFLYHFVRFSFIGYILSLIYLTILWYYPFITFKPETYMYNLIPFIWVREVYTMGVSAMVEQLVLNIGMFIPYGFLLPLLFTKAHKWWQTFSIVLGTTVVIETIQFFMGRSADIDDVIMNFFGGAIGYLVYLIVNMILMEKKWWIGIKAHNKSTQ